MRSTSNRQGPQLRADNSAHLITAAREGAEATRTRALRALRRLDNAGSAIAFETRRP